MFIAAIFTIARTRKQTRCPSTDEWIKKLWCIYTMEYYSTIKGVGNSNPLQCSCLENSRDRGAWWAAIYGVAQSQTQLK